MEYGITKALNNLIQNKVAEENYKIDKLNERLAILINENIPIPEDIQNINDINFLEYYKKKKDENLFLKPSYTDETINKLNQTINLIKENIRMNFPKIYENIKNESNENIMLFFKDVLDINNNFKEQNYNKQMYKLKSFNIDINEQEKNKIQEYLNKTAINVNNINNILNNYNNYLNQLEIIKILNSNQILKNEIEFIKNLKNLDDENINIFLEQLSPEYSQKIKVLLNNEIKKDRELLLKDFNESEKMKYFNKYQLENLDSLSSKEFNAKYNEMKNKYFLNKEIENINLEKFKTLIKLYNSQEDKNTFVIDLLYNFNKNLTEKNIGDLLIYNDYNDFLNKVIPDEIKNKKEVFDLFQNEQIKQNFNMVLTQQFLQKIQNFLKINNLTIDNYKEFENILNTYFKSTDKTMLNNIKNNIKQNIFSKMIDYIGKNKNTPLNLILERFGLKEYKLDFEKYLKNNLNSNFSTPVISFYSNNKIDNIKELNNELNYIIPTLSSILNKANMMIDEEDYKNLDKIMKVILDIYNNNSFNKINKKDLFNIYPNFKIIDDIYNNMDKIVPAIKTKNIVELKSIAQNILPNNEISLNIDLLNTYKLNDFIDKYDIATKYKLPLNNLKNTIENNTDLTNSLNLINYIIYDMYKRKNIDNKELEISLDIISELYPLAKKFKMNINENIDKLFNRITEIKDNISFFSDKKVLKILDNIYYKAPNKNQQNQQIEKGTGLSIFLKKNK